MNDRDKLIKKLSTMTKAEQRAHVNHVRTTPVVEPVHVETPVEAHTAPSEHVEHEEH